MAEYKQQQQPNPIQTMQLSGSINKIPTIEDLTMYEHIDGSEEERCGNTPTEKVEWGYFIDLEAYNNIKNAFRNVRRVDVNGMAHIYPINEEADEFHDDDPDEPRSLFKNRRGRHTTQCGRITWMLVRNIMSNSVLKRVVYASFMCGIGGTWLLMKWSAL